MKTFYFTIIFSIATANFSLQGQIMTLEEIKNAVRSSHPAIRMYDAEVKSMDASAQGAWSWMPPEIGTGFFMMPYNPAFIRETEMEEGMGQYVISIEQMLPNRKRQEAEFKYMNSMSNVAKESKEAAVNELIADAKINYVEWVVLSKKIDVIDESEKLLEFMIRNAEIRYKNGIDKLSAYYKAKAALGNIQSMRLMLENEIDIRRIEINTLMNRPAESDFQIDTNFSMENPVILNFDTSLFTSSRSDIRSIDKEMQVTGWQEQMERSKLKPEFGFRYEHMIALGGQPSQYSAMAMVKLPMVSWASRMNKANVANLKWKNESLRYKREMLINELYGMGSAMIAELQTKQNQIKVFEENTLPALRNNYQTMQIAYEQNTEELFELYDAWESLNMSQLEYLDLLMELYKIQVELERILEIK